MAKQTEDDKILYRINKRFLKGIVDYGLITDGDKILVGLSGGKDSMALLELLALRSRIYKPRFSVVAVHVEMSNIEYKSDISYLESFSRSLGVPFSQGTRLQQDSTGPSHGRHSGDFAYEHDLPGCYQYNAPKSGNA